MSKGFDDNKSRMVVEKKYTDTDMKEFAEWTSRFQWVYSIIELIWWNRDDELLPEDNRRFRTTAQLLQEFKDWKEANND
jgi:molybdenum cofactor biosynthesis enzyme MoaA